MPFNNDMLNAPKINGSLFLCLILVVLGRTCQGEDIRYLLHITPFVSLPKAVEDKYPKSNFDNGLEKAAEQGIVFKRVYDRDDATYYLTGLTIAGELEDSVNNIPGRLTATGKLESLSNGIQKRIGVVEVNAGDPDVLMARFWRALDRPLKAFQIPQKLDGHWDFSEGRDEMSRVAFFADGEGEAGEVWASYRTQDGVAVVGTAPDRKRKDAFNLTWNSAGFFEGFYTPKGGEPVPVKARRRVSDAGAHALVVTGDNKLELRLVPIKDSYQTSLTWVLETENVKILSTPKGRGEDDIDDKALAKRSGAVLGFKKPERDPFPPRVTVNWKDKDRATITSIGTVHDWVRIEVFVVEKEWHVYYLNKNAGAIQPFEQALFKSEYQHNTGFRNGDGCLFTVIVFPQRNRKVEVSGKKGEAEIVQERLWCGFENKPKVHQNWPGFAEAGFKSVDAAVNLGNGRVLFFYGANYLSYDSTADRVLVDPQPIGLNWQGTAEKGFDQGIDAAVNWGDDLVYLFRGANYLRYDMNQKLDEGYPKSIADGWPGLKEAGFDQGIDAVGNWGNGKAYFFRGTKYVRYDIKADKMDEGYPYSIDD